MALRTSLAGPSRWSDPATLEWAFNRPDSPLHFGGCIVSYEWIRRRKRYLSFRYLFPELVAPWIQLKRAALRVVWFFTHPIDEFIEDLGELIAWPFVTLAKLFAWMLEGVRQFVVDLFSGVETFLRYLGRLPVWTGSAIAGALGIIMTILLFFLQVASFEPVPLSAGAAAQTRQAKPLVNAADRVESAWRPQPLVETNFDAFAGTPAPEPEPEPDQWRPTPPPARAGIDLEVTRLSVPFAARERIDVVSAPTQADLSRAWTHFERMSAATGWSPTRGGTQGTTPQFTPYVVRQPLRNVPLSLSAVRAGHSVSPFTQVQNNRQPAVSITRTAPSSSSVGSALTYELLVRNQGLEPLDSVLVHERVSAIERVMNVEPAAHLVDDALVWRVHDLQPREERRLTIEMRPDQLVPVAGGSIVQVKTAVAALSRVSAPLPQALPITQTPREELNVFLPEAEPEPQLTQPEPLPEPEPQFGLILPTFHDEPEPEAAPESQTEPELQFEPPSHSEPVLPEAVAQEPAPAEPMLPLDRPARETSAPASQWRERVQTAGGKGGVPIFFEMRTPRNVALEKAVATVFEIRNPGTAPLTKLVILVEVTDELDHTRGRILEHRIEKLAPGGVYFTRLTTTAVRDGKARVRSTLTSAEDLESTLEAEIEVRRPKHKPPTQLSKADLPRASQSLPTATQ
jgi:hypothetical protein